MKTKLKVNKINVVIDCQDAGVMADFYSKLLDWEWTHPHANGWAAITSPDGTVYAFQEVEDYQPPVWPWEKGKQGQMLHLDFYVDNLEEAVQYAVKLGAKQADTQYFRTSTTMIDPAGHPFCLDTEEEEV
ncbi:VOC family protein [Prevotella sp. 10(H)]|uniref:VOC family protein n=1 Tax=Prevotella sp. 10(H) TaxID=1158294 RepID=UPI0004A7230E|nr:VOC family protein [Prevotella sp. 10(H)]